MIKNKLFSIVYMFLLTLFFTGLVSAVHTFNQEEIRLNEHIKLQKIILHVLGMQPDSNVSDNEISRIFNKRIKSEEQQGRIIYRGYGPDGTTLVGYAFPLFGPGFWGPVFGMIAVDDQLEKIHGIAFYKHSETPGLGGRITEEWFVRQFKGKRLVPVQQKYFFLRPPGTAQAENEVDAITGATGTSRAVEKLLNSNLAEYLALLAKHASGT